MVTIMTFRDIWSIYGDDLEKMNQLVVRLQNYAASLPGDKPFIVPGGKGFLVDGAFIKYMNRSIYRRK